MKTEVHVHREELEIRLLGMVQEIADNLVLEYGLPEEFKPEVMIFGPSPLYPLGQQWRLAFKKHIPMRLLAKYKWPRDWWEAFKERWFPQWLLKKYPVRYHKIRVDEAVPIPHPKFKGDRFYVVVKDGQVLYDD